MSIDTSHHSAQPVPKINNGSGFTKKEYAAIMLRVPTSGTQWLDEMIDRSNDQER